MIKRGHDVESAPSIWRRRTAMEHYAGIDVSLELSSVCVVDAQGKIVRETKVASEPDALVAFFASLGFSVKRIGLEAGPLSQWLHAGLKPWRARSQSSCIECGSTVQLTDGLKRSRLRCRYDKEKHVYANGRWRCGCLAVPTPRWQTQSKRSRKRATSAKPPT